MRRHYITTSIAYANAEPHIGFAMELIYADVLARYHRQQGDEVIFSTGTDEHGGKIAEKAKENNKTPMQFVNDMSLHFSALGRALNISNNRFIRTTDQGHIQRSQKIWSLLSKDIYKGKYSGWYCEGEEAFFSDTEVKATGGICPTHNRPYERIEEENYFFRLSAYNDRIKTNIMNDSFKILPLSRKNEILSVIDQGLEDISISRPKDKISWGIEIPNDQNQVMYVWFEALMNYITVLGYPEHEDFKSYWPANTQVIGKDILRFHAAIWPAILLALDLQLPEKLFVHGFVTAEGKKMSKSIGNVVNPNDVIAKHGADALRYYLLRYIPSGEDGDFSWNRFEDAYNNELADELGNLVQRTAAMVERYLDGKLIDIPPPEHDIAAYLEALSNCRFDRALDSVWEQIRGLNQFVDEEKPWEIVKTNDKEHLNEVLAYLVSSIREVSSLLAPFMPQTSEKISSIFGSEKVKAQAITLFPKEQK